MPVDRRAKPRIIDHRAEPLLHLTRQIEEPRPVLLSGQPHDHATSLSARAWAGNADRAGSPGAGGGLWLRMIVPSGRVTWLVPSGWTVSVQPSWCSTT